MTDPITLPAPDNPLRVLVVDDIGASRAETASQVRASGHHVLEADSGAAALRIVETTDVDLVLLDLLMPDMDGFEATRRLRAMRERAWLPIVVMSSLHGAEHFVRAVEEGADDYLVKPVDGALLAAKIRNIGHVLDLQARVANLAAHNRELFDHVGDAVLTIEDGLRICDANAAGYALLGLDALPDQGAPLDALLPAELAERLRADTPPAACQALVRGPAGDTFPADIRISRWRTSARPRVSLVIRDLTEQRRLDRLKDDFLSTVSHELRTPLTSVKGAVDLLAGGAAGELPAPAQKLVDIARRNGERLGRLIDDVLDVAKLEADRMTLQRRACALDTLVDEALAANLDYARRVGVTLTRVGAPFGCEVWVDPDRFLQVMANLLSNAIKNSPAGSAVEIRGATDGARARIAVRDHGGGIPEAFRARIFEKFSQADERDRRVGTGTGLGLHITQVLVERMHGTVGLISTPGHGAEFHVDLPTGDAAAVLPPARPVALVIDPDPAWRARIAAALAPRFATLAAASAEELGSAAVTAPALLVADPSRGRDAPEALARRLREIAGPAPILLYTDDVSAAAPALAADRLPKRGTDDDALLRAARRIAHPDGGPHR
ncbi:ATP-binding response regulator [Burkholderia gladioli]|uniref:ATP-binding response regulator n=1 Tax=Burkholderia gladioli TaxID=28095 RepID=UPI00163F8097|nr:ATP-binding protein [Burkholderia gladioli]